MPLCAASKSRGSRSESVAAAPGAAAGAAGSASASAAASLADSHSRSLLRHLVWDREDREKRGEGEEAALLGSQGVGDIEEGGCEGGEYGEEDEELDDQVGPGSVGDGGS